MVTGRLQLKQKYDGSQVAMLIYVQNSGNNFLIKSIKKVIFLGSSPN